MSNLARIGQHRVLSLEEQMQVLRNMFSLVEGFAGSLSAVEGRMSSLEIKVDNEIFVNYNQQRVLQKAVGRRVREMLKSDNEYHANSRIYFAALYSALKDVYQVPSYREIPRIMFDHAMKYIQNWEYQGAA